MVMYREHFGLHDKPFSIAPDPRFLYMSQRHREALAHLLYGIGEGGGFVQLTGEVGTGKTTVCRCLLEQLPDNVDIALILNPKLNSLELVASICDELGIDYVTDTTSIKVLIDALNQHLLDTHSGGRRTVLIIDEAQNLSAEVLEQIRLLTNLETSTDKLLQIILIGQPELSDLLNLYEMRQLAQRITARYHLGPLSPQETRDYIQHRLRICGGGTQLFAPRAADEVYRFSGGVPRLINILCDRALLGAYAENQARVDKKTVRRAASEVKTNTVRQRNNSRYKLWPWVAMGLLVIGSVWLLQSYDISDKAAPELQAATERGSNELTEKKDPSIPVHKEADEALPQQIVKKTTSNDKNSPFEIATKKFENLLLSLPPGARQLAREDLMVRWGVERNKLGRRDVCAEVDQFGLRCMRGNGTWARLRSLDRPALLELATPAGGKTQIALQALDRVNADVALGGAMHKVPLKVLDRYWTGEFTLIWRSYIKSKSLSLGDSGEDVVWLRSQMKTLLDINETSENPAQFDEQLQEQVKRFQSSKRLTDDGVAGRRTLIQINSLTQGAQVPRLSQRGA